MDKQASQDIAEQLTLLAAALSSLEDTEVILERLVDGSLKLSKADAATLYLVDEAAPDELNFHILKNTSLKLTKKPENVPPLRLHDESGSPSKLVAAQTFLCGQSIVVDDAYNDEEYDFSGTKRFDKAFGYRSTSFVCVPLRDHEGETIGVIQLINALDDNGQPTPFDSTTVRLIESLASMLATVLTKVKLIDSQKKLFEDFIQLLAQAIDKKNPVTGKHCQQVPEIAMMIADAIQHCDHGPFADVLFSEDELYELKIAAWLHDCGKITTPDHVIDKATKLQQNGDRIELIETRSESLRLFWQLEHAKGEIDREELSKRQTQLSDDLAFIKLLNQGGEFLDDCSIQRLDEIATYQWTSPLDDNPRLLITEEEHALLSIRRGTLTEAEREIMKDHIRVTLTMLESLSYPKHLRNVPDIAANHHEHMDGSGYPRGLNASQLGLRDRIMCIADIFEALTAPDRPYKAGKKLSETLGIMSDMVQKGHLDSQLFRLFVEQGVYQTYADRFMRENQLDQIDSVNHAAVLPAIS